MHYLCNHEIQFSGKFLSQHLKAETGLSTYTSIRRGLTLTTM